MSGLRWKVCGITSLEDAGRAVAAGADALFMEVHDDPDRAKSDAATVFPLDQLANLLTRIKRIATAVRAG